MRFEIVNGRKLLCGHIFKLEELEVGSKWAQADGSNRVVQIRNIEEDRVQYGDYGCDTTYEKDYFDFQRQFCLVVKD